MMRKRPKIARRQQEVKLRKNFSLTLFLTILLWIGVISVIFFLDPYQPWSIPVFFLILFFALFFTLSIVFINSRRGFFASLGLTLFAVLRYFGVGNILNLLLIIGVFTTIEIYLSKK